MSEQPYVDINDLGKWLFRIALLICFVVAGMNDKDALAGGLGMALLWSFFLL